MGRRRKKKVIKIYKPKIPEVFTCPVCGSKSLNVKIDRKKNVGHVICGSCNVTWETTLQGYEEKVDVFHMFFDAFSEGKI
jgi:transcription elongation factor Elf1